MFITALVLYLFYCNLTITCNVHIIERHIQYLAFECTFKYFSGIRMCIQITFLTFVLFTFECVQQMPASRHSMQVVFGLSLAASTE